MRIQAVIFDVYSTLLDVGPAPADAEALWQQLFRTTFQNQPWMNRLEFSVACSQAIARRHAGAKARGVLWPEIHWPSVVLEVLPELAEFDAARREAFVFGQIQTGRTIRMPPEAALTLSWLRRQGRPTGIASNSQAYTLRELGEALREHGLEAGLFAADLCFWSFEHGFSKPDPHVFQHLTLRLEARGITPGEVLMVGDRPDNDIAPARVFDWQTWQLAAVPVVSPGGSWTDLLTHLQAG